MRAATRDFVSTMRSQGADPTPVNTKAKILPPNWPDTLGAKAPTLYKTGYMLHFGKHDSAALKGWAKADRSRDKGSKITAWGGDVELGRTKFPPPPGWPPS